MGKDPWDTPAMRQFRAFKAEQPGCVLFFRMGDFYELFGEDAEAVAPALGLALTERGNGIPIAGVPHHQRDRYLQRAIDAGFRVAVVDQVQDPREAKGVVDRAITQVVTPGTLVDESLLADGESNALAAVTLGSAGEAHAAIVELSTGAFVLWTGPEPSLADELARAGVRELLFARRDDGDDEGPAARLAAAIASGGVATTPRPSWHFEPRDAAPAVREVYAVASLEGFGVRDDDPALPAAAAVVRYLCETQSVGKAPTDAASGGEFQRLRSTLAHLRPPRREAAGGACVLDAVSLRALEIERTIRSDGATPPGVRGSLLGVFLDAGPGQRALVRTAMGKRMIRRWLCRPLSDVGPIVERQNAVATLIEDRRLASELGDALSGVLDVERIAARVALGRPTPRDLVGLGASLRRAGVIAGLTSNAPALSPWRTTLSALVDALGPLAERIGACCVDDPPASLRQGGLFRDGVDAELDGARLLQRDAGAWLVDYQARLIAAHGLPSLKVGYNKVFGYFIELPAAQARRAPDGLRRTQTLKNAERYTTPELASFEERVTSAESRAIDREHALFRALVESAAASVADIGRFADAVATLDALLALADKAVRRAWVRPVVTGEPVLSIRGGRHPVLDEVLERRFVANDADVGGGSASLAMITGPNMAGKSTFIRQTALITVLASIGSWVPADAATVGVCDRIFTRVGADDALHRGQSTFMVEMTETAAILNNATPGSLVILDEIGRGTGTLDGLALAWAIAETLAGTDASPGPRTLFATHYHELTELDERLAGRVRNLHVAVKEWAGDVVFLHRIRPGRAAGSYGVHVARLAGVPEAVTRRAGEVMASLRVQTDRRADGAAVPQRGTPGQMGLFTEFLPHPAVDRLKEIKIDHLSPVQAFDALRELIDLASRA